MSRPIRLLVGGCSMSDYAWPTWADYLGLCYSQYANTALAGSDNANIARRVIDAAQPNDLVVILWSGFDRWQTWLTSGRPYPKSQDNHWVNFHDNPDLRMQWIADFYNPVERFYASMDYVHHVHCHSQVLGYQVYHFSAFPWMCGQLEKYPQPDMIQRRGRWPVKNDYLTSVPSLEEYQIAHGLYEPIHTVTPNDFHPGPWCQYQYLRDVIAPVLQVELISGCDRAAKLHDQQVKNGQDIFDKRACVMLQDCN